MKFEGFKKEAIDFFNNLAKNNNKDWFDQHRSEYLKYIKEPAQALIAEVGERTASMGLPYIADQKRGVFRINRDVRFSSNKDPYKTNLGVYFPYSISGEKLKTEEAVGYYFHLSADEIFTGAGMYAPPNDILKKMRIFIADNYFELEEIIADKELLKEFPESLYGESLKKMPLGFPKDHPAERFLKMKSFLLGSSLDYEQISSANLVDLLARKASAAVRLMNFIYRAKA